MLYTYKITIDIIHRPQDIPILKEVLYGNAYNNKKFIIEKDENWIDIGAHIGCFSLKVINNLANVISYEPCPTTFEILKQNVPNAINCAVSSKNGTCSIKYGSKDYFNKIQDGNDINMISFNDIIFNDCCIKMDIEGSEMDIIDNCDFNKIKKLVIAYHTAFDRSVENLNKRINRLKTFFTNVEHAKVSEQEIMNRFPNELFIYCWN